MEKIFSTAAILLISFFVGLSYSQEKIPLFQKIPWKIFYPAIQGNIGDYQITVPEGYMIYDLSDFGAEGFLWGDSADITFISSSDEELKIDEAENPIFRVRFTKNTFVNNGRISDNNGPLTEASFKKQGIKDLELKSGFYHGIKAVPVISLSGNVQNTPVYMIYFFSPVNNMVVLVNLQGGKDAAITKVVWNNFVESLNL